MQAFIGGVCPPPQLFSCTHLLLYLIISTAHSVILSARCLICLEMGQISETIAIRKVLQSRPALKEVLLLDNLRVA